MSAYRQLDILHIEDSRGDAHALLMCLNRSNLRYQLHHAETLYDGTRNLPEGRNFDVALLDLTLPDSRHLKTLNTFKERLPHLPVIVMTGTDDDALSTKAIKAGAQDYIVKGDYDAKVLTRTMRYAIERFKQEQERKAMLRQLEISEQRLRESQKLAHIGTWELDIVTSSMEWTQGILDIIEEEHQFLKPTLTDYINLAHVDDRPRLREFFEEVNKTEQPLSVEHRIVVQGHRIKHVCTHARFRYDKVRDHANIIGGMQDVTNRKAAEEESVQRQISERSTAQREAMLGDIGFQIRTPLSSLHSLAYVFEGTASSSSQAEHIDSMKDSIDDLSVAVNNLLNFTNLVTDKLEQENREFEVEKLLQRIVKSVQIKADKKDIKLKVKQGSKLPERTKGDESKIYQTIHNVLDNAIKYSDEGARVFFEVECIAPQSPQPKLYFKIKDKGQGMTGQQLEKVRHAAFDIEESLEPYAGKRRPMGMIIVNKLTEVLGGALDINSQEGIGTTVEVSFPVQPVQSINFGQDSKPTDALHILMVEDNFMNRLTTNQTLKTWSSHVTVTMAEDGQKGVDLFHTAPFDLVLMDLQMPHMDGLEATRRIREVDSQIPIIALTATADSKEAQKCMEAGMNDYLTKPYQPNQLFSAIMSAVNRSIDGGESPTLDDDTPGEAPQREEGE